RANPHSTWLDQVNNDDQFVERLLIEVDAWTPSTTESFGGGLGSAWNRVKQAGKTLKEVAKSAVSAAGGAIQKVGTAASNLGAAAAGAVINPVVRKARPSFH